MRLVYIGLGSNVEPRLSYLRFGIYELGKISRVLDTSSLYETEPWGFKEQPKFLNAVVLVETRLDPFSLLDALKEIEARVRVPRFRWGPRELDLDILLYEGVRLKSPSLEVPHPRMWERDFVMVPLMELWGKGWPRLLEEFDPEEVLDYPPLGWREGV